MGGCHWERFSINMWTILITLKGWENQTISIGIRHYRQYFQIILYCRCRKYVNWYLFLRHQHYGSSSRQAWFSWILIILPQYKIKALETWLLDKTGSVCGLLESTFCVIFTWLERTRMRAYIIWLWNLSKDILIQHYSISFC